MKIEMGESLFYSWLRHVKECQIVQTNWKVSQQWNLMHQEELEKMLKGAIEYFQTQYNYNVFKQNSSLSQIIQQGECDVIGVSVQKGINTYYAVDVAFHEAGLNYGSKEETIMKVIAKSIRTAMCLYGCVDTKKAEIIFASPKINPAIMTELDKGVIAVNALFHYWELDFTLRVIANEEFESVVLHPITLVSDGVADTSELFMRSYQMYTMFAPKASNPKPQQQRNTSFKAQKQKLDFGDLKDSYNELKIGQLANIVLRKMLEDGCASEDEIQYLQEAEYSKTYFDLQYPLLVREDSNYERIRYYKAPLVISGVRYVMCSQWFEVEANNDRPYLLKWIEKHSKQ